MSAARFALAHTRVRLRGTPLLPAGAGVLATVGALAALGLANPGEFAPAGGGRAAGLAAFLADVYRPVAVAAILVWGTGAVLAGLHRRRRDGLVASLAATWPGGRWLVRADVLATCGALLALAALPLPLHAWAWQLGVATGPELLRTGLALGFAGLLAALAVHAGARLSSTFGGAYLCGLALELAVCGVAWHL